MPTAASPWEQIQHDSGQVLTKVKSEETATSAQSPTYTKDALPRSGLRFFFSSSPHSPRLSFPSLLRTPFSRLQVNPRCLPPVGVARDTRPRPQRLRYPPSCTDHSVLRFSGLLAPLHFPWYFSSCLSPAEEMRLPYTGCSPSMAPTLSEIHHRRVCPMVTQRQVVLCVNPMIQCVVTLRSFASLKRWCSL